MGSNKKSMSELARPSDNDFENVMNVGEEYAKGKSPRQIASALGLETREVNKCIEQYKQVVSWSAKHDLNVYDKINLVIEEVDRHYQLITREAWENKENAEMAQSFGTVNQALKLIADVQKSRASMFQTFSDSQDVELIAQMEEQAQQQEQLKQILMELREKFPEAAKWVMKRLRELDDEVEVEVIDN